MKLLILPALIGCLAASNKGQAQTITLSLNNAPIEKAFKEIKKLSGYSFVYTRSQLKSTSPVTFQATNASIKEVLGLCFENQPLSYLIEERYVIVQTKSTLGSTQSQVEFVRDISGKVVSETGEILASATIELKNSKKISATNEMGEFFLQVPADDDILVVTSVGHMKEEVGVKGKSYLLIQLKVAIGNLDETVVKGYYSTSKRLNTGSVSKISEKELRTQPVSNPLAALQGRMAGLFVTQVNGLPGSNFNVIIRGRNSIQNSNSPLYIVDGVPFLSDADRLTQRSTINANSPFNTINPLDIESIEVLKDADAITIYGSRGANGVIIITSKRNRSQKAKFDLNVYTGWGSVTRTMDFMNTDQYIQMRREALENDGVAANPANAPDLLNWDTTRYTDWKKVLIGGTAKTLNSNISYSAGNEQTQFAISGNYYSEETVYSGEKGTSRGSVAINFHHSSKSNKLQLSFASSYGTDKGSLIRTDLTQFINMPPMTPPLYDAAGNLNWTEGGTAFANPFAFLLRDYNVTTDRLTSSFNVKYKLTSTITLGTNAGFNNVSAEESSLFPIASQNPSSNPKGSATFANNGLKNWIIEPQVEYNPVLGKKLKLQLLGGTTFQKTLGNGKLIDASGYTNDLLLNSTAGAATLTPTNSSYDYKYQAVYARVFLNWQGKYLINLTGRRDGSSRFGPGKQYGNFGAAGGSWIFSNSKLFEKLNFISFGKLRSSLGVAGNEPGQNYQYLDTWTGTQYNYQGMPALRPTRLFNDNYAWEEIKKLEFALELGFLKDRIYFIINRFQSRSKNQLISYTLPNQTGFTSIFRNFPGVVENSGWEIELNLSNIRAGKVEWQSAFNLTLPRNRLKSFPGLETSSYANTYMVGKSLNLIRGFEYNGINPSSGIYEFQDNNADGQINSLDFTYIGTSDPEYYGGFYNQLRFRQFSLDIHFSFVHQTGRNPVYSSGNPLGININLPVDVLSHWKKSGDVAPYQRFSQNGSGPNTLAAFNMSTSSGALTNASYARLKNISLSFMVPTKAIERFHLANFRLYCQAQNLLTITKYSGFDPENQSASTLPPLRMVTAGIQVTL